MKKFVIAAITAASVVATPAMAATSNSHSNYGHYQNRDEQRHDTHNSVRRHQTVTRQVSYSRHWKKGDRFDRSYASNYRVIAQPHTRGLKEAPRGYRWVQSGNDAVLVGITSGLVAAIVTQIIR